MKTTYEIECESSKILTKAGLHYWFEEDCDEYFTIDIFNFHWLNNENMYNIFFNFFKENDFHPVYFYYGRKEIIFNETEFKDIITKRLYKLKIKFERKN